MVAVTRMLVEDSGVSLPTTPCAQRTTTDSQCGFEASIKHPDF